MKKLNLFNLLVIIIFFISCSKQEIQKGMNEINIKYGNNIKFNDKLICVIL